MFRFSHRVVAVGYDPSFGRALTGSRSPCPAIIGPSTCFTKSGALSGTAGGISITLVAASGTVTSNRFATDASTAL